MILEIGLEVWIRGFNINERHGYHGSSMALVSVAPLIGFYLHPKATSMKSFLWDKTMSVSRSQEFRGRFHLDGEMPNVNVLEIDFSMIIGLFVEKG